MKLLAFLLLPLVVQSTPVFNIDEGIREIRRLLQDDTCCVDLMFVVDQSESVGIDNWRKTLDFICQLAKSKLEQQHTRVGIIRFGNPGGENFQDQGEWWIKDYKYNTEVIWPLNKGFLVDQGQNICNLLSVYEKDNGYRPGRTALRAGLLLALKQFRDTPKPDSCDPAKFRQWSILVTDGGPNPPYYKLASPAPLGEYEQPLVPREAEPFNHEDPCHLRLDLNPPETKTVSERMIDAGVQQMIIGIGERFSVHKKYSACALGLSPDEADSSDMIVFAQDFDQLLPIADLLQPERFCECGAVDLTILMDQSGSLCSYATSSLYSCTDHPEFDKEIDFAKVIVSRLNPWDRARVAVYKFGNKVSYGARLRTTGALSDCDAVGQKYCTNPTQTQADVLKVLDDMKKNFEGGETALAMGLRNAIWELKDVPPRKPVNGKIVKPKKVLLFMGDGGPNTPFYNVGDGGIRTLYDDAPAPCKAKSKNGYCIVQPKQWDGSNDSNNPYMHQAVCLDDGETGGQPIYPNPYTGLTSGKTFPEMLDDNGIVPIMVMVGPRANAHERDIQCLVERPGGKKVGSIIKASSFTDLFNDASFANSIGKGVCGVNTIVSLLEKERTWALQWKAWLESQSVQSTQSNQYALVFGAAAVIGVAATALFLRASKSDNDYMPLDMETV